MKRSAAPWPDTYKTMSKDQSLLQEIVDRLDRIEAKVDRMANPSRTVSIQEKSATLRRALDTGDKRQLRLAVNQINGGRS